jgi:putative ABC transport system permease protein
MFQHNLLLTYRNFKRYKGIFFINLIGLSTGLACSILIFVWVQNEMSYDHFNVHAENIYRLTASIRGETAALSCYPLTPAIKGEIPQVKNIVRVRSNFGGITLFEIGGQKFEEKGVLYTDPTFFEIFSFPLIEGNNKEVLLKPDGLVITERICRKYFGSENAIGKIIRINDTDDLVVKGILKDVPANSHLQFDFLLPMSLRERTDESIINNLWDNFNFYTYIQFEDRGNGTTISLESIEAQLNKLFKRNTSSFVADFTLQPLLKIHLYSDFQFDVSGQGNIQYVRIFSMAAIFILIVVYINFMNLATARFSRRAKEIGVRKVIGANRSVLIGQLMTESLVVTFVALLLAICFVVMILPLFNEVSGKRLTLTTFNGTMLIGAFVIFLVTSFISGFYPSFFLSAFQPIQVLKGGILKADRWSIFFRNALVVFQFSISIVLFVCTIFIYNQLHFIQNKNLGYNKGNLLYLPLKGEIIDNLRILQGKLESYSYLNDYSIISELPTNLESATIGVEREGKEADTRPMFSIMGIDQKFIDVFKVKLLTGRGFSEDFKTDATNYIVNEKALRTMDINAESAIGQHLTVLGKKGRIIGVVKDFNFKPIHEPIESIILSFNLHPAYLVIRTAPGRTTQAIKQLESIWVNINYSYGFEYGFVDQELNKLYLSEQRMGTLFNAFAALAIFISFLGLSGLVAFISEHRTKEIGIRKVLGASVPSVFILLSVNFTKLVLLAFAIAVPLAWYGMDKWLEAYAYRINLEWWVFGVAGVLALLVAICTTTLQSAKTALMNPVKSLGTE